MFVRRVPASVAATPLPTKELFISRVILLLFVLSFCDFAPAVARATPVSSSPPPALIRSAAGAVPVARIGFGRSYGFGRHYGFGGRGYGRPGFGFGRRGHGFVHGLFWGFLLGHWFSGGGFPVFPFLLLGLFAWFALRSRRRSRWNARY